MTGRAVGKLVAASVVMVGLVWGWWWLDPTASNVEPVILTALLAVNVVVTMRSRRVKRWVVAALQRFVFNPPVKLLLRLGLMPFGLALLETTGRVSGQPRRNPVGNGRVGQTFWLVAEHGWQAGYVRNIAQQPRVRLRMRDGLGFAWFTGTAEILPDDDPFARQQSLGRWHPLRWLNAMVVRVMGTDLLTVRIDLDAAPLAEASSRESH